MLICRICGETKTEDKFKNIKNFTKYKKQKNVWCCECQTMYLERAKENQLQKKLLTIENKFEVSFE